ncbi:MAG: exosortase/archaeosortase family protein [Planctomycetes bacterium]|nr:exosortase/archaeosortase family protein [Planctomycetota bacterium]
MSALLETYAEQLAGLVGWLCGLAVADSRVLGTAFVLEFDVACTAALVTLGVAVTAALITPGALRDKLAMGAVIVITVQGCNLVRLTAIAWSGEIFGTEALVLVHDWIAPVWMSAVIAIVWTFWWQRLSNQRGHPKRRPDCVR